MKQIAIIALMGLAGCSPAPKASNAPTANIDTCLFEPQRDITAYEAALVVKYAVHHKPNILLDYPGLKRHFKCEE